MAEHVEIVRGAHKISQGILWPCSLDLSQATVTAETKTWAEPAPDGLGVTN